MSHTFDQNNRARKLKQGSGFGHQSLPDEALLDLRPLAHLAGAGQPLVIDVNPTRGYAFIDEGGNISDIVRSLNTGMIRRMPGSQQVQKPKGAVRAYEFHWSNAQHAWSVFPLTNGHFPWGLDGAGFIVFVGGKALSPIGKTWTRTEMEYVAKQLSPHPGYAGSFEAGQRGIHAAINEVSRRFLASYRKV